MHKSLAGDHGEQKYQKSKPMSEDTAWIVLVAFTELLGSKH